MDHTNNTNNMNNVGTGCGESGCECLYCNGDNYDRYMSDHLSQMLNEINSVLPVPVRMDHDQIKGDEELYYKVIMRVARSALESN